MNRERSFMDRKSFEALPVWDMLSGVRQMLSDVHKPGRYRHPHVADDGRSLVYTVRREKGYYVKIKFVTLR